MGKLRWLLAWIHAVTSRGFVRSVAVLVTGAGAGQLIVAAAMPVIARLYSPEDFRVLAVFNGVLLVIAVVAGLRFDIAVSIPDTDSDGANLFALAMASSCVMAGLTAAWVLLGGGVAANVLGQPELEPLLWLLPLGVLAASAFSALQYWFVRRTAFRHIAVARITQSLAGAGTQTVFGVFGAGPIGLIVGQVLFHGGGVVALGWRAMTNDRRELFAHIRWARMHQLFRRYAQFPRYSTFEALFNTAGTYIPVVMIGSAVESPEAGFLLLAMTFTQAPVGLFSTAVMQVYISRGPHEHQKGTLGQLTTSVVGGLVKAGVGPIIFGGIVAPVVVPLALGEAWRPTGDIVLWMVPWLTAQLLASPISVSLHITGKQRIALALQAFGLAVRVASVASVLSYNAMWVAEAYALSSFLFYSIYLVAVLRIIGVPARNLVFEARSQLLPAAIWLSTGLAIRVIVAAFL